MKALRSISWLLVAAIAAMIVTGGVVFPLSKGFIEISQVNVWMLALGLITLPLRRSGNRPPLKQALEWILVRARHPAWILGGLGIAVIVGTLIHSFRLYRLETIFLDQGIMHHVLVSSWVRKPFQCDVCINGNFLANHLAFTLLLIAPLAGIFRSSEMIFLIQCLLLAGGAGALLFLGPLRTERERLGVALLVILAHSYFRFNWFGVDFREDHLAFFFLCLAGAGLYSEQWTLFAAGSALAALSKESVAFVIPFLCLIGLLQRRKQTVLLVSVAVLSMAWIGVSFGILFPHWIAGARVPTEITSRFTGMGETPGEVVRNLFLKPATSFGLVFGNLLDGSGLKYLALLVLPWAFFLWKGRIWLTAALPGLLMNLVSGRPEQRSLRWHYELLIYPFLILGTLEGIRRSSRKELLIGLFFALSFSERWPGYELRQKWPTSQELATMQWFRELPPRGLLAAGYGNLGPAAMRAEVAAFGFSEGNQPWVDRARWILVDTADSTQTGYLRKSGWSPVSRSPEGRFILLAPQAASGAVDLHRELKN